MKVLKRKAWVTMAVFALFLICAGSAGAHSLWATATPPKDGVIKGEIGYSDMFPASEAIAEDRLHIFEPLKLITPEGTFEMERKGENYTYELAKELKKGSVIVVSTYKPTFWSKGPDNTWAQTNRKQRPDATYVEEAAMYGKTIVSVDGGSDVEFITKPVGMRLEIVPQVDPATVKPGGKLPVQVLFEGNPLKTTEVLATFEGFSDKSTAKAFRDRTDLKGMVDIIPLKAGYWCVSVAHVSPYEDKSVGDEVVLESTFTFHIAE